jgi:hypothetical protein
VHGLIACGQFVLPEESHDDVLQMLANANDRETARRLHRILIHAPVDVPLRRESDLLDTPNLPDEVISRINRREDLSGWPGAKLWQELQDFVRRSEDKRCVGEIDHAYANDLVEALGPHEEPDAATICEMFSERSVEVVRPQIHTGYDRTIVCLEDRLLLVAHALGIELPEADAWRAERAERECRQAERRAELDKLGRRYQAMKARGIDPFAKSAEKPKSLPREQPLTEAVKPVRLDQPRVGRNDRCPCGSGKKFKKCCFRKPR